MYELVKRCQQGDPGAFDELFDQFYSQVLRTAYFVTHNVQEAEDAAQETFLDVHRDIRKLRNPDRFQAWLRQITIRQSLKRVRLRTKGISLDLTHQVITDNFLSVEDSMVRLETQDSIRQALTRLSPIQRSVLVLKYYHELMEREIAETLGCSIGTVKSRLHYAKKELGHLLEDMGTHFTGRTTQKDL